MGYEIHIERTPAFTLEEWRTAVRASDGVRLEGSGATAVNLTREVISIAGKDGDAQVNIGGRWLPCFRWRRAGSVAFNASADFSQYESELRKTVRQLAGKLSAVVRGDDGEGYD
jgi:hypothetical protein